MTDPANSKQSDSLSAQEAREWLDYDPDTGHLIRKKDAYGQSGIPRGRAGTRADVRRCGARGDYRIVFLRGKKYLAHRLIWLLHYGHWPTQQIDHINRDPSDNRLCNLRDVSASINVRNSNAHNKTGHRGVYKTPTGYTAQVCLGTFRTAEEASAEYGRASRLLYGLPPPSITSAGGQDDGDDGS